MSKQLPLNLKILVTPLLATRALEGGGKKCPPLRFFADSGKTAARSAGIFSVETC